VITSVQNAKIKWVRSLQSNSRERREAGAFVVEGVRLVEEALSARWAAKLVLYTGDLDERGQRVVQGFAGEGAEVEAVAPHVLRAASDTETPQGVLAVIAQQALKEPQPTDFVFIPDGVRDPGNLGTMLRTAAAAGVDAVFLPPHQVDAFSPKVVRAGMGAHFRLPILALDWEDIRSHVDRLGLQVYLAAAAEGVRLTEADFRPPLALIVGGEAEGAGQEARTLTTRAVHIPMPGGMESLNAAIAAAILMFEVVRQRSTP